MWYETRACDYILARNFITCVNGDYEANIIVVVFSKFRNEYILFVTRIMCDHRSGLHFSVSNRNFVRKFFVPDLDNNFSWILVSEQKEQQEQNSVCAKKQKVITTQLKNRANSNIFIIFSLLKKRWFIYSIFASHQLE